MTRQIHLNVNDAPIETDYFVEGFVDHTVAGMVSSLEGIGDIRSIEMKINGTDVALSVNAESVPLNDFAAAIVGSTVRGMISPLKGVENTDRIQIGIER